MQLYRSIALILSASLSAGCMVGPDYKQPQAPLADHYQGWAGTQAQSAGAVTNLDQWWTGFADPALSGFVRQALAQNLDLAQAQARLAQARAALGSANAALSPSAGVDGQAARAYQSIQTPLGQVLDSTPG